MKIIVSEEFSKLSKSKYPKSETEPTNPWAVCTKQVGREDKDKYERCVHHIKDQNREENKKKKSFDSEDIKLSEKDKEAKVNPWAVCTDSVGRKDKDKYERCVHDVKNKNKGKKSSDLTNMKPSEIGGAYGPAVEEEDDKSGFHTQQKGRVHRPGLRPGAGSQATWDDILRKIRKNKEMDLQFASTSKRIVIEAKKKGKWIQDAVEDEGSFTEYCGGNVTQECIDRGKNSPDPTTKRRAELAETLRGMGKKKKKK